MKKISMIQDWDDDHMKKKGFFFVGYVAHFLAANFSFFFFWNGRIIFIRKSRIQSSINATELPLIKLSRVRYSK